MLNPEINPNFIYQTILESARQSKEKFIKDDFSSVNATDFELETIFVSNVVTFVTTDLQSKTLSNEDREIAKNKIIQSIKTVNADYFVIQIHKDIIDFIYNNLVKNNLVSPWHIKQHLCSLGKYKSCQASVTATIDNLIINNLHGLIACGFMPLSEIAIQIAQNQKKKLASNKIKSGEFNVEDIKKVLEEIEFTGVPEAERLKTKVEECQKSNGILKTLALKELRLNFGLTSQEVQALIESASLPPKPELKVKKGSDFLVENIDESAWLYPGLVPAESVTLLTGSPGAGKTALAYSLALSYLAGSHFLGEVPSRLVTNNYNRKALIINADQPPQDARQMLKESPLAWANADKWHIIDTGWTLQDIMWLDELVKQEKYGLIVIDCYNKIHSHLPTWDENSASAGTGIDILQKLSTENKVSIVVIHHGGKGDNKGTGKSRGSTSIPAAASCHLALDGAKPDKDGKVDPSIRFLEISKIRNDFGGQLTLKFDPTNYDYSLLPDTYGQERMKLTSLANSFLNEFIAAGTSKLTFDDLLKKIHSMGGDRKALLHKVLTKLERRGAIRKEVDPSNHQRKLYSLILAKTELSEIDF